MKQAYINRWFTTITIIMLIIDYLSFGYLKVLFLKAISNIISKKTNSMIRISDYRVKYGHIEFREIIVQKTGYTLKTDKLEIFRNTAANVNFNVRINIISFARHIPNSSSRRFSKDRLKKTDYLSKNTVFTALKKLTKITHAQILVEITNIKIPIIFPTELSNLSILGDKLTFVFVIQSSSTNTGYKFVGIIKEKGINYRIYPLYPKASAQYHFSKAIGRITFTNNRIAFQSYVTQNTINHPKLCTDIIRIPQMDFLFAIDINEKKISFGSDSYFHINGNYMYPKSLFSLEDPDFISLAIHLNIRLEAILTIIPNLKCNELYSLTTSNNVNIQIKFAFLRSDPLSYNFKINYNLEGLIIDNINLDLSYLNNEFIHEVVNQTGEKKLLKVRTETDLTQTQLSRIIQHMEDPSFFKHIGIDEYNIGRSIALNIANKRFVKGASTITMQLVKNLFLDNDKNLVRKFEELILTLLVENHFKISKNRILEIYLQIIPFSKSHYGIQEASNFYFNKKSNKIELLEAIVLSYIVPRPLYFLEAVNIKSKQLDTNLSKHINYYYPIFKSKLKSHEKALSRTIYFSEEIGPLKLTYLNI